ncbi:MAG: ABC-F family ATP-binding cassette domain-containing protein, partial [Firmicutes bacterium]|nr:ABC-F family ATP-binding cassette domain-containing protein [Candidatus Scatoplasma merdavium]
TIEWLESYLKSYSGALLFVSHDRYFIDALSDKIFELDQGQFNIYVGDYSSYSKQKRERYLTQLEAYKRQQKEIKKLQWFIDFYMPKPRFSSRAHDREKKLARIEKNKIDKPTQTKNNIHINLTGKIRKGKEVLKIDDLSIGYSSPLITGINADIYGKDRIAVMGSNGSGKTTFVKTLLGQIPKLSGDIDFLIERNIGYLSQDSIQLNLDETIFDYLHSLFPDYSDQKIYDHLARYGFSYEDDKKNIQNLSGGEKMRLIIAEMTLHDYDFLILDEPTNHLDMMTKQELLDALNDYQGTLLVVSHDRYFLDALCDKVLYFFNKKAYFYHGNYTSFKQEVLDSLEAEIELEKKNSPKEKKEKVTYNTHQKKVYPKLSKQKIEEKLAKLESELSQIEQDLQKEEVYSSYQKMEDLTLRQKQIETEYESLMEMLEIYEN